MNQVTVEQEDDWLVPPDGYHPPLHIVFSTVFSVSSRPKPQMDVTVTWNFKKANFPGLYHNLQHTDWGPLYSITDPEQAVSCFYEIINRCLSQFVPTKPCVMEPFRYVYPEWYTGRTITNIRTKAFYHRCFKSNSSPDNRSNFMQYRAIVKLNLKEDFQCYKSRMEKDLQREPAAFWGYVASKRSTGKGVKRLFNNGNIVTDDRAAQCFADYFYSVYSPYPPCLDAEKVSKTVESGSARIHIPTISESDVKLAIKSLKPKRSVGPDGIPPYLVKDCGEVLRGPLWHLYRLCLEQAFYPDVWKMSRVVPVPKGSGSDVSDYRPVAVLSVFGKLFESILQCQISQQFESQITDAQHGFRVGRSTSSNLLSFWSYVVESVDSGSQVDAAYLDFRKAFDTVDNDKLIEKFSKAGFTPPLLRFFCAYLGNRQQYVQYKGYISKPYCTYSGVSQGSNLGPLEFLIMVNDLPEAVSSAQCLLFADDLKLFLQVQNVHDCARLQDDIDNVLRWTKDNKLFFNEQKCSVITFSRLKDPIKITYTLDQAPISTVSKIRDLGVVMSEDMSFRSHIEQICKKAFRTLGFVLRQCRHLDSISAIKALYNAFVRSTLESSMLVWCPYEWKYVLMVEKIQKKFLRWLYQKQYGYFVGYPFLYPSAFVQGMCGYDKLEVRRKISLMEYIFAIITGRRCIPSLLERIHFTVPDNYIRTRRHTLFGAPLCRTESGRQAPLVRALRLLNALTRQRQDLDLFHCTPVVFHTVAKEFVEAVA